MNIFSRLFANKKSSASIAKERLQIIVAHERNRELQKKEGFDLESLQNEIIQVIAKHLKIEQEKVNVQLIEKDKLENDKKRSIFELNVDLPESH